MKYASGEEPKVGDTVLGDKLKGRVALLLTDKVQVKSLGPFGGGDSYTPASSKPVLRDLDPADLTLVHRG